jgi:hypothetical protein
MEKTAYMLAGEAIYNSLGYIIKSYMSKIKPLEKEYSEEFLNELAEFNIAHVMNEIMEIRQDLNKRYKIKENPLNCVYVPQKVEATGTKTEKDLSEVYQKIHSATIDSIQEFKDSLLHYKKEGVDYSIIIKTVQQKSMIAPIKYLEKLAKKADEKFMESILASA